MLGNLRIHWKFALFSATLLTPIALLVYLLIGQAQKDIRITTQQLDGYRHIASQREALGNVGAAHNANLAPDLSSYHSMDIAVTQLPLALEQAAMAKEAARRVLAQNNPALTDIAELRTHLDKFTGILADIDGDLDGAYRNDADERLKTAYAAPFNRFRAAAKAYVGALEAVNKSAVNGAALPRPELSDVAHLQAQTVNEIHALWALLGDELERLLAARITRIQLQLFLSLGVATLALALAGLLAWRIGRSVSQPMSEIATAMDSIAAADLSAQLPEQERGDEVGLLIKAAGEVQRQLRAITTDVGAYAAFMDSAVQQYFGAVEEQSAVTIEMSASVTEITSTMEELSASSTQIAEYSKSVVDIATRNWENSKRGSAAMQTIMAKMSDIRSDNQQSLNEIIDLGRKSKEISTVMEIINTVADQTRLIAFNAALEASSAGEAGRRFGVVAAEIRRLADSVTESTHAIEAKICEIQDSISRLVITSEKGATGIADGMSATASTAEQLGELVAAASQTSTAAQQISLSTQQQKTASSQVVIALREIVTASNQSTESIDLISQTSRNMTAIAADLNTLVSRFKLAENTCELW